MFASSSVSHCPVGLLRLLVARNMNQSLSKSGHVLGSCLGKSLEGAVRHSWIEDFKCYWIGVFPLPLLSPCSSRSWVLFSITISLVWGTHLVLPVTVCRGRILWWMDLSHIHSALMEVGPTISTSFTPGVAPRSSVAGKNSRRLYSSAQVPATCSRSCPLDMMDCWREELCPVHLSFPSTLTKCRYFKNDW